MQQQLHTVEIKEDGHSFEPILTAINVMVAAHPQLTHVGLDVSSFRRFGRNGRRAMAAAGNPAITELDLSHNHISNQGALALAAKPTITQLDVSTAYLTALKSALAVGLSSRTMLPI